MKTTLKERLLSKVLVDPETRCWNWTASLCKGYGQIIVGTKPSRAHRVSFELFNGPVTNGLHVCHTCDNRKCVNPEHLFLGTNADNTSDKVAKGRQHRLPGESHGRALLTEEDVLAIRANKTAPHADLAAKYGVSAGAIQFVRQRRTWKHI